MPAREVALFTLRKMAEGGIYDQLGGGFCRYSVDERWMIPHFEKMLYDNGPLLRLVCRRLAGYRRARCSRRVCEETAAWVMREMQSPEGGYYSSLDADSEHEEGKFYVWSREQVARSARRGRVCGSRGALWSEPAAELRRSRTGICGSRSRWSKSPPSSVCPRVLRSGLLAQSTRETVRRARDSGCARDATRRSLTAWNALMIHGMAHAARVLAEPSWLASARRALRFLRATLWRDGRLLATYKDGTRAPERLSGRLRLSAGRRCWN